MCWWAKPPSTALNNQIYGRMVFSFCVDSTYSTIQPHCDRVHFAQNIFIIGLGAVVLIIIDYLWYLVAYDAALMIRQRRNWIIIGLGAILLLLFIIGYFRSSGAETASSMGPIAPVHFGADSYGRGVLSGATEASSTALLTHIHFDANIYGRGLISGAAEASSIARMVPIHFHANKLRGPLSEAGEASSVAPIAPVHFGANNYGRGPLSGAVLYLASASSFSLLSLFVGATVTAITCLTSIPFQASLRGYGLFITEYFARIRNAHIRISDFLLVALVTMVLGAAVLVVNSSFLALSALVLVLSFGAISHGWVLDLRSSLGQLVAFGTSLAAFAALYSTLYLPACGDGFYLAGFSFAACITHIRASHIRTLTRVIMVNDLHIAPAQRHGIAVIIAEGASSEASDLLICIVLDIVFLFIISF